MLLRQAHKLGVDIWAARLGAVDIRLDSTAQADLMAPVTNERPEVEVLIEDLQQVIESQKREVGVERKGDAWYEDYHTFEEIQGYMRGLEESYKGHVGLEEIGRTHEGRPILALKLSDTLPTDNSTTSDKLGIVITGGQHAREWISTSASLFFASDLLRSAYGPPHPSDPQGSLLRKGKKGKGRKGKKPYPAWTPKQARAILRTFSITIIPISNPDGYVYSWTHNRMWRKNRQPSPFPSGVWCKGVDLNRNYAYAFSSSLLNPCSESYAGSAPFSAAETKAIASYLQNPLNNVVGYFDLHSYGQLLMYPYSYSCEDSVPDEEDLLELSLGAVSAIRKVHGKGFGAGKICQVYAQAGGNSVDWSYASTQTVEGMEGKRKVKWSYSVELRDGGTYGFLLPKEQIKPASEEVTAGLAYMLSFISGKAKR